MKKAEQWMASALEEARKALGPCHPNPAVGAIVMHDDAIVARGFTQPPGSAHAEVVALQAFAARGAPPNNSTTLVVTLEPCCTHGRTPPCTDAIIASGIKRVMVGATDANPAHSGRGFELMREAGIAVETGVLATECRELNLAFDHRMRTGSSAHRGEDRDHARRTDCHA